MRSPELLLALLTAILICSSEFITAKKEAFPAKVPSAGKIQKTETVIADLSTQPKWLQYPREVVRVSEMACTMTTRHFAIIVQDEEDSGFASACPRRPRTVVGNDTFLALEASVEDQLPGQLTIRVNIRYAPQLPTAKGESLTTNFSIEVCGTSTNPPVLLTYRFFGTSYRNRYGLGPLTRSPTDGGPLKLPPYHLWTAPIFIENPTSETLQILRVEASTGVRFVAPEIDKEVGKDVVSWTVPPGTRSQLLGKVIFSSPRPSSVEGYVILQTPGDVLALRLHIVVEEPEPILIDFGVVSDFSTPTSLSINYFNDGDTALVLKDLYLVGFEQNYSLAPYLTYERPPPCLMIKPQPLPVTLPPESNSKLGTAILNPLACVTMFPAMSHHPMQITAIVQAPFDPHAMLPSLKARFRISIHFVIGSLQSSYFRILHRPFQNDQQFVATITRDDDDRKKLADAVVHELVTLSSFGPTASFTVTKAPRWLRRLSQQVSHLESDVPEDLSIVSLGTWIYNASAIPTRVTFIGAVDLRPCCRPLLLDFVRVNISVGSPSAGRSHVEVAIPSLFINGPFFLTREYDVQLTNLPDAPPEDDPVFPFEKVAAPWVHPNRRADFLLSDSRITEVHFGVIDIGRMEEPGKSKEVIESEIMKGIWPVLGTPAVLKRVQIVMHNPLNVTVEGKVGGFSQTLVEGGSKFRAVHLRVSKRQGPVIAVGSIINIPAGGTFPIELELLATKVMTRHPEGVVLGSMMMNFTTKETVGGRKPRFESSIPITYALSRGTILFQEDVVYLNNTAIDEDGQLLWKGSVMVNSTMGQAFRAVTAYVVKAEAPAAGNLHYRFIHPAFEVNKLWRDVPPNYKGPIADITFDPFDLTSTTDSETEDDGKVGLQHESFSRAFDTIQAERGIPPSRSQSVGLRLPEVVMALRRLQLLSKAVSARFVLSTGPESTWTVPLRAARRIPSLVAPIIDLGFSQLEMRAAWADAAIPVIEQYILIENPTPFPISVQLIPLSSVGADQPQTVNETFKAKVKELIHRIQSGYQPWRSLPFQAASISVADAHLWERNGFTFSRSALSPALIPPFGSMTLGPITFLTTNTPRPSLLSTASKVSQLTEYRATILIKNNYTGFAVTQAIVREGPSQLALSSNHTRSEVRLQVPLSAAAHHSTDRWPTLADLLYHVWFRPFDNVVQRLLSPVYPWDYHPEKTPPPDAFSSNIQLNNYGNDPVLVTLMTVNGTNCGSWERQGLSIAPCTGWVSPVRANSETVLPPDERIIIPGRHSMELVVKINPESFPLNETLFAVSVQFVRGSRQQHDKPDVGYLHFMVRVVTGTSSINHPLSRHRVPSLWDCLCHGNLLFFVALIMGLFIGQITRKKAYLFYVRERNSDTALLPEPQTVALRTGLDIDRSQVKTPPAPKQPSTAKATTKTQPRPQQPQPPPSKPAPKVVAQTKKPAAPTKAQKSSDVKEDKTNPSKESVADEVRPIEVPQEEVPLPTSPSVVVEERMRSKSQDTTDSQRAASEVHSSFEMEPPETENPEAPQLQQEQLESDADVEGEAEVEAEVEVEEQIEAAETLQALAKDDQVPNKTLPTPPRALGVDDEEGELNHSALTHTQTPFVPFSMLEPVVPETAPLPVLSQPALRPNIEVEAMTEFDIANLLSQLRAPDDEELAPDAVPVHSPMTQGSAALGGASFEAPHSGVATFGAIGRQPRANDRTTAPPNTGPTSFFSW